MTGKLFRIIGSAPMVRKLADDAKEKVAWTESLRSIFQKNLATRDMSFTFVNAA